MPVCFWVWFGFPAVDVATRWTERFSWHLLMTWVQTEVCYVLVTGNVALWFFFNCSSSVLLLCYRQLCCNCHFTFFLNAFIVLFIFCVFVVVADDVVENFQTLRDDTFHCTLHFCVSFSDMDLVVTNTKLQVALTHLGFIRSSSMNLRSFFILWVIVHVSSQEILYSFKGNYGCHT